MASDELKAAEETARRAVGFLESRQNKDGRMLVEKDEVSLNVACYYKSLWAFASAGRLNRANMIADVISSSIQRKNGDFASAEQRKGDEWFEWRYYTYANLWIVIGAHKIGRFDISIPGISYLLTYQDPRTGGFCNEAPYPRGVKVEDSISTAAMGLVCLYTGRVKEAAKAGGFLVKLLKMQPEIKTKFYTAVNGKKGLITEYAETDAVYRVVDPSQKEQFYFMVGLPIALLPKLYLATAEKKYLDAAKSYFEFTTKCNEYAYSYPAAGKSGFAAAVLSRITGRKDARDAALRQLAFYGRTQASDGSWKSFPGLKLYGDGSIFPGTGQIDITAEFTVWINEALQELK